MSKKKELTKAPAQQPSDHSNAIHQADNATALLDARVSTPIERPQWIDGAPVTTDGRTIKDGSSRDDGQMRLRSQASDENVSPEGGEEVGRKNWSDPYKAIFTCPEMGFELGEHRRFGQRIFHFVDKPTEEILGELKANKFIYRGAEKAWTIPANAETRKLTDDLARKWAGPGYSAGIER